MRAIGPVFAELIVSWIRKRSFSLALIDCYPFLFDSRGEVLVLQRIGGDDVDFVGKALL